MKPEIAEQWVAALRSGEFKQGKGCLRNGVDGEIQHCCLGVLCELHRRSKEGQELGGRWLGSESAGGQPYSPGRGDAKGGYLPVEVKQWAGLADTNPAVSTVHGGTMLGTSWLGHLNDQGEPFESIAAIIERNQKEGTI